MICAGGARQEASTLGLPVVPLVYMMVHRSWGLGGMGSAGCFLPSSMKSSQVCNSSPAFSCMSCAAGEHSGERSGDGELWLALLSLLSGLFHHESLSNM